MGVLDESWLSFVSVCLDGAFSDAPTNDFGCHQILLQTTLASMIVLFYFFFKKVRVGMIRVKMRWHTGQCGDLIDQDMVL